MTNDLIYLDSAATTKILPEVLDTMMPYLTEQYGNPSSHYTLGTEVKKAVEHSREIISDMINVKPQEIYFTSGGSEANTWAIKGVRNAYHIRQLHIISTSFEHHSVLEALETRRDVQNDMEYALVNPDINGIVTADSIANKFKLNTRLVSCMMVNNEIGTIQPIKDIASRCQNEGIICHTDAVQAFGYQKIDVKDLGIDMLSASGHKIYAPKGVGFLYISDEIKNQMSSLINGGQQERGLRGSTENVAAIVGLGKAAEIANNNMNHNNDYIKKLCKKLLLALKDIPGVHTNVDPTLTDYRHISIRIDDVRAEELLAMLDTVGVCVSSGSACNSDSNQPSHVLKAIKLTDDEANSTIRISLSEQNTTEELKYFIAYLQEFIKILRGEK